MKKKNLILSLLMGSSLTLGAFFVQAQPVETEVQKQFEEGFQDALFVQLANGEKVLIQTTANDFQKKVIPAQEKAAKLSERSAREVLQSKPFIKDGLSFQKQIYHHQNPTYTRYEISMTAVEKPIKFSNIVFFENLPIIGARRSGNTDGSVIVGEHWYMGVEHPMAKVTVTQSNDQLWTPKDFKKGFKQFAYRASKPQKIEVKFDYEKGPHRLDIEAIELLDSTGKVIAFDQHKGYSGLAVSSNIYTLDIPEKGNYQIRAIFKKGLETDSYGRIICLGQERQPTTISAILNRSFELKKDETWTFSFVFGNVRPNQLRRDFQAYLERERAHPYRLFPHYNSWYDLCISRNDNSDPMKRMTEETALSSMRIFNQELYKKRGVSIESYLLDDGWDNWDSLWDYHVGFPNRFDRISKEVKSQKSGLSAWLSPWGGYGGSKGRRVENARRMGLETPHNGLSLAQPKYYNAFRDRCLQMIADYDMNMFKFDGIGSGTFATGAADHVAPDLEGMVRLIAELRDAKANLFINCTVGTWASPFWVLYADSLWRGGNDCDYLGEGPQRERWITYRDAIIHDRFASVAPLFPLNSMMSHGIIVGNRSVPASMLINDSNEATTAFANEVWMGMACGTGLQEYYISPELMSQKWWDILAEGVTWLRQNQETLRDVHWVGGSPRKADVYGYASYSEKLGKGILILRNPSSSVKFFKMSYAHIFEMPADVSSSIKEIKQIYSSSNVVIKNNEKTTFSLELPPFETILIEVKF